MGRPVAALVPLGEGLKSPPARGQRTLWDVSVQNFGCRLSQGGTKSWIVMHGRRRQVIMKVIAEGVETEAPLAFLRDNHCDEIQGYHFSKPVGSDAIAAMLRNQTAAAR